MLTHRGGEQAVDREHHERDQHEHAGQLQHAQKRMGFADRYELRQEGHEEDRQLRIEDIDRDAVHDDAQMRARVGLRVDARNYMSEFSPPGTTSGKTFQNDLVFAVALELQFWSRGTATRTR